VLRNLSVRLANYEGCQRIYVLPNTSKSGYFLAGIEFSTA